ncbi:unnamed protein product [Dovyalis caffra]|uniref:Neprosin PEP catalytic domain-containing protein n=1 Tax=Dovyalis caffra TaxID=77055 RepID=A0AAV1SPZ2_9ROSI|nr:unnamed protein product [Dovyalis caffra]
MAREIITKMLKLAALLLTVSLLSSRYAVNGRTISIDVEVGKELEAIRKHSLQTINTEYGDIYDCVEISKQPSLHHPLLKDHEVKGVAAHINLYNPAVQEYQQSAAYVTVQNGNSDRVGIIQAGWMVYPHMNLDYQTRLFTQWDQIYPNGSRDHSYGTMYPGFVVVNKDIPVDAPFPIVSTVNGTQFFEWFMLTMVRGYTPQEELLTQSPSTQGKHKSIKHKDPLSGDWWWSIGDDNVRIGYWPKELFVGLQEGASIGIFGGLAETDYDALAPPMGSGVFEDGNYETTCHMKGVQVNIGNCFVSPYDDSVYVRQVRCYKADKQDVNGDYPVLFGGPGGSPASCV